MLTQKRAKKIKSQKGATVVEFALLAAVFFVILLGFMEFGFLFLQTHFVANAAREGVRIGIVANNYECFSTAAPGEPPCTVQRSGEVGQGVLTYLSTLYDANIEVSVTGESLTDEKKILTVTATAVNFMPVFLTGLMPLLDPDSTPGDTGGRQISYTAEGEYEDPSEDRDNCIDIPGGCTVTFLP